MYLSVNINKSLIQFNGSTVVPVINHTNTGAFQNLTLEFLFLKKMSREYVQEISNYVLKTIKHDII